MLRNIIIQLNLSYHKPQDFYASLKCKKHFKQTQTNLNFIVHNLAVECTFQVTKLVE